MTNFSELTTPDDQPDSVLVARAKDGDTYAFDALVQRYQRRIYALAYHMTSSHEDADDIVQDTFTKAYRSLRRFQGNRHFTRGSMRLRPTSHSISCVVGNVAR